MSQKRVLVTGGAGFIGSHVAELFRDEGYRVWIVDDLSSGKRENVPEGATFVHADIRSDAVAGVFRDAGGFDVVSHHAAQIDVRIAVSDPRRDASLNIDGFLNVAECARAFGCGRFVFVSSGGVVYGEPELRPTPESAQKLPRSPYGVTKLAAEQYLYYYREVHGMEYAALRYANVYGPRQDPHGEAGVVAIFCNRLRDGEPVTVFGDGEQTRDYVFVRDCARANLLVGSVAYAEILSGTGSGSGSGTGFDNGSGTGPGAGPFTLNGLDRCAFNVGTGSETSVTQLAHRLMSVSGRTVEVQHAAARAGEVMHSCISPLRLEGLGWTPSVSLDEGLEATYRHIAGETN